MQSSTLISDTFQYHWDTWGFFPTLLSIRNLILPIPNHPFSCPNTNAGIESCEKRHTAEGTDYCPLSLAIPFSSLSGERGLRGAAVSYIPAQPPCGFSTEITRLLQHQIKSKFASCLLETPLQKSSSGQDVFYPPDLQATSGIFKKIRRFVLNLHFSQWVYLASYVVLQLSYPHTSWGWEMRKNRCRKPESSYLELF